MWERFGGAAAAKQGIFSIPRGQDPPPTPFQTVAAVGASQWKSFSKSSLNAAGGPKLKAVIGGHSASSTRTTASLAPSQPPRWLVAVPQVSSKPKKTPWQRGAGSVRARGTLRESLSPPSSPRHLRRASPPFWPRHTCPPLPDEPQVPER